MINRERADHYLWGDGCDGWHLVRDVGLSVIQERMPPATSEVMHHHARARQFFYVLVGTLTVIHDGAAVVLHGGDGIEIAPGTEHQVCNDGREDAEFLVVSQPPSHGDRQFGDGRESIPPIRAAR